MKIAAFLIVLAIVGVFVYREVNRTLGDKKNKAQSGKKGRK